MTYIVDMLLIANNRLILWGSIIYAIILSACQPEKAKDSQIINPAPAIYKENTSNILQVEQSKFLNSLRVLQDSFPNYQQETAGLIDTILNPYDHWFIKTIVRERNSLLRANKIKRAKQLPDSSNISQIKSIFRAAFFQRYKHMDDLVIEQWIFNSRVTAETWRDGMSNKLRSNVFTKPPREQWTNGDTLFLVSTRSAQQWFEQNDKVIKVLTGKTRWQISLIYDPLDLKAFKKKGGAHSGPTNSHPYLYNPTKGYYFRYFFFTSQRLTGEEKQKQGMEFRNRQEFRINTFVQGTPTGEEDYLTIKEKLVEIQCSINDPNLGALDIVGKNEPKISQLFGDAIHSLDSIKIYGHADRVFAIKFRNETVTGFKYMWLDQPFTELLVSDPKIINSLTAFTDQ